MQTRGELTDWLAGLPPPTAAFVVHGEPSAAAALASRLENQLAWNAVVPKDLEKVRLA